MSKQVVRLDGLNITATLAGDPGLPCLLLLHGWPHSRAVYDIVLDEFSHDFFVIAPDLPGVGESTGKPASGEKAVIADLVLSAAEKLRAKDIVIAGFDVGGMTAFAAARDYAPRIRGAVVANTVIPGIEPWSKVISNPHIWHFAFHAIPGLPETLVMHHQREYFDFFTEFLAGRKDAITETMRAAFAKAYERADALSTGFDWYRAFDADAKTNSRHKAIATPMLYLRGDADGRSIDDYVAGLKGIGVEHLSSAVVQGSGEFLPLEAPEDFVRVVRDFARKATARAAKAA
jgi:pimeloyl-ACP methyl ester carboxylesterase